MIEYRQLANILAMFLIVQLSGMLVAFYFIYPFQVSPAQGSIGAGASPQVILYFIYIVIAGVIMALLFRRHKGPRLYKAIEAFVVVFASFYLFLILIGALFPANSAYPIFLSLLAAIGLIAAKNRWPGLRNLTAVISSIGVGLVLGIYFGVSFGFFAAYVFMALIALYDYVAVFVTKHMIALGRESVDRNLAFLIGSYDVELMPKSYLRGKELRLLSREIVMSKNTTFKRMLSSGSVPMPSFSALGAGDLAIPLMLEVSAYTTYFSFTVALVLALGAALGLIFSMYVSKKYATALPAIPPLFAFASIALSLLFAVTSPANWQAYLVLLVASAAILALILFTARRQSRLGQRAMILPHHLFLVYPYPEFLPY